MNRVIHILKLWWEGKKFARVGRGVVVHYSAVFHGDRSITLGDEVMLSRGVSISGRVRLGARTVVLDYSLLHTWGGEIEIGSDCTINPFCILTGQSLLKIGNGVRMAPRVVIMPVNHIFKDRDVPIREQGIESKGITIEDDVWIGAGAIILDGVKLGKGSVVAAGAVVTRDVEPYKVVAGVPARVIKDR